MSALPGEAWVFHAGALGDSVLVWPLLRALGGAYARVHVVSDHEKASLAASCISSTKSHVIPHDAQRRAFTRLWAGRTEETHAPATLVIDFLTDESEAGRRWRGAAAGMFPNAEMFTLGPPGSASRRAAWKRFDVLRLGAAPAAVRGDGPVVCHVGAGSAQKRWPLEEWGAFSRELGLVCRFIAGEVERDRFTAHEGRLFDALGGCNVSSLVTLADTIRGARVFVGADSGPTHLAAQLGVPTLALFGPTDPRIWSPVGPRVTLLAPTTPTAMAWIDPVHVADAVRALLSLP